MTVDYDYEEQVRKAYRPASASNQNYNRDTYNYQEEPSLYGLNDQNHQTLKLYEERLMLAKLVSKQGK